MTAWGPALLIVFSILIGVLYSNKRLDDLRSLMTGRFDDLRSEMNSRFDDLRDTLRAEMNAG